MTIECSSRIISKDELPTTTNNALVSILPPSLSTISLKLKPDPNGDHNKDQVIINYNSPEPIILTGLEINNNDTCKKYVVSWKPE